MSLVEWFLRPKVKAIYFNANGIDVTNNKLAVCLIACSAVKARHPMRAEDLYQGDLFRKSLAWARLTGRFQEILVLSAKHGVVQLEQVVEPYNMTLNDVGTEDRRLWAQVVARDLMNRFSASDVPIEFVALAGRSYMEELSLELQVVMPSAELSRPLTGLGIGEQKAWLKKALGVSGFWC